MSDTTTEADTYACFIPPRTCGNTTCQQTGECWAANRGKSGEQETYEEEPIPQETVWPSLTARLERASQKLGEIERARNWEKSRESEEP